MKSQEKLIYKGAKYAAPIATLQQRRNNKKKKKEEYLIFMSKCEDVCKREYDNDVLCETCPIQTAFQRLAEYEATELSPEEVMTLKELKGGYEDDGK